MKKQCRTRFFLPIPFVVLIIFMGVFLVANSYGQTPSIEFTLVSSSGGEGVTPANLQLRLSEASLLVVTVNYAVTGGTATGGGVDYTLAAGVATITAGNLTTDIPVTIVNDTTDETDETVIVTLSDPTNATLGTNTVHTYTIQDDDIPAVSFSGAPYSHAESGSQTVTVAISQAPANTVTVNYATSNGTATAGSDYTAASGTLTWLAGDGAAKTFDVPILTDTTSEANETVNLTLSGEVNCTISGTNPTTLTIQDDDIPAVSFSGAPYSHAESGSQTVTVAISQAPANTVTVNYATSNGTATAGSDYTAVSSTLTWVAGDGAAKTFDVPILTDTTSETNETVNLTLSGAVNCTISGTNPTTLTIQDDDIPAVSFSGAPYSHAESGSQTVTVAISQAPANTVTVNYATSNGTATAGSDYTAASGTLTWLAGDSAAKTFDVPIITDTTSEANETVNLTLSGEVNCTIGGTNPTTLTIQDDDIPAVSFSGAPYSHAESGSQTVTVAISQAPANTVTVNYTTSNGTATAGSDYTAASGTLTWLAGDSAAKTFDVPIITDTTSEANETVNLTLSGEVNCTIGGTNPTTLTIQDDDIPAVSFSGAPYSHAESGSQTVTVAISQAPANTVTVNYTTSNGTATAGSDYTAASGTLTWLAGDGAAKTFDVPILADTTDEPDETVNLTLSAAVNCTISPPNPTILTIADDDSAPTVSFSGAPYTHAESGTQTVSVTLSSPSGNTVTVNYATSNGTATAGSDYTTASGTLTWLAGDATAKTFLVPILADTIDEPNETVNLALSVAVNCTISPPNPTTLTITDDDDAPTVSFSGAPYTHAENGSQTVTVTLSSPSGNTVTVNYATSNGTATAGSDYTAASGTLTWLAGDATSKTFLVPILTDTIDEPNETVNLTLLVPVNCTISGTNPTTLTITDDDSAPTVSFSGAPYTSAESGSQTVTVALSAASGQTVTVNYATSNGTATAGSDYTAASGTLTWPAGDTAPKTFSVPILADVIDETDETVLLTLSGPVNATISGTNPATLTITDDDTVTIQTSTDSVNITEGATAFFTAQLTAQPLTSLTVTVSRISGDTDITVQSGTSLTFTTGNWNLPQQVTLAAAEDVDIVNGTATIRLSAAGVANKDVTATEQDNDTLQFATNTDVISVPENSTAQFQVRLTAQPPATVTASVVRFSGDTNITVQSGASLTFTAADWNDPHLVTLAAAEDVDVANGTAIIRISATGVPNKDVTANEQDNDTLAFQTSADTVNVPEGSTASFTVQLSAQPSATVTAAVARFSGDANITVQLGASLTFTTGTWNSPQTVTLAAAEDPDVLNGTATIRISATGIPNKDVTANEQDNDTLAFQTSADTVNVPEGATATFDVRLSAQPSSNVAVTVSRSSGDSDITVQSGASLTFTMSDWNTFQTVTLAAAEDVDVTNGSATIRIQAAGLSDKDVTAVETDDDTTNGQITLPIVPAANAAGLFVEVSVAISNNPDPVGSFGVDFSYDDAIFVYKRIEAGTLTPDWTLSSSDISVGKIRLTGVAGTGIPASSSGSLIKVVFQVKCLTNTQEMASQIRIDNFGYDLYDRFLPVPCVSDFTFKPCPTLGDVNADGNITPGDAQNAFEVFLGRAQPDFCQVMTSDSNCSLSITPGDAQSTFEHFLGRRVLPLCCTDYAGFGSELVFEEFVRLKRPFPERRVLYALDTTGLSGEMVTVPMVLTQPQGIRSFSFELSYPADILEYVGVRKSLSTEEFAVVSGQVISTGVVRIEGEGGPPVRRKTIGSLAVAVFRVKEGDAIRFPLRIYNPDKDLANVETRDGTFARLTDSRELKFLSLGEGIMESGVWRVPLEVSNPFQLKAFGLDLRYSFEKMTFLGIERAGLGREIFELDAHEYEPGKIRVGGFNLSEILETTPDVLLELVFSVREQGGEVEINEVMDDFKSFFITKKLSRMD